MSLNTNGWDLIYNIKFGRANSLLKEKFINDFKVLEECNKSLAESIAGGFKQHTAGTGVEIAVRGIGSADYTVAGTPGIKETQLPLSTSPATLSALEGKGILKIDIIGAPSANNFLSSNFSITNLPDGVDAKVKLKVKAVNVTNGGDYGSEPTGIQFSGGDGTGVIANIIFDGLSAISAISVTNSGRGYTQAPTVTVIGGETVNTPATLEVVMEPYVEILQSGEAELAPGNIKVINNLTLAEYSTLVTLGYGKIAVSSNGSYNPTFLLPPIVYATGTLNTNNYHPVFYTSFKFINNNKNIVGNDVKASIKKCFGAGIISIIDKIDATITKIDRSWLETNETAYKPKDEPNATTVKQYCLDIVTDFLTRLYAASKDHAESDILRMIRRNVTYKSAVDFSSANISSIDPVAFQLLDTYTPYFNNIDISKVPNQILFLNVLINEEIELIKNRIISNVLWIENQIFFNTDGSDISLAAFKLDGNQEGFIESMIQIVKSLVPALSHNSFKACNVQNKDTTSSTLLTATKRKYDRVKLLTGPIQFRTGGSGNIIKIELPILKLIGLLGEDPVVYDKVLNGISSLETDVTSAYQLPLTLNASWVRAGFKSTHISTLTDSVHIDLSDADLDAVLKNTFNIVKPENRTIVKACLHQLINEEFAKKTFEEIVNVRSFKNLYNSYLGFFNELLILFKESIKGDDLKWMFPTSYNIAVKDDANIPTLLSNSVLSLCCMINGNKNNDLGYVDINAIPPGANSALVIERSVFGEYMVVPKVGKDIFKKPVTFRKLGAYSFINNEEQNLAYADYVTSQTYFGLLPVIDWLSSGFGGPTYRGNLNKEMGIITLNQDSVDLRLKDVQYMYSFENHPKISQEYTVSFSFEGGLKAAVQLVSADINYFHTDFYPQALTLLVDAFKNFHSDDDDNPGNEISILNYFRYGLKKFQEQADRYAKELKIDYTTISKEIDSLPKDSAANNDPIRGLENFPEIFKEEFELQPLADLNDTDQQFMKAGRSLNKVWRKINKISPENPIKINNVPASLFTFYKNKQNNHNADVIKLKSSLNESASELIRKN